MSSNCDLHWTYMYIIVSTNVLKLTIVIIINLYCGYQLHPRVLYRRGPPTKKLQVTKLKLLINANINI